MYTAEADDVLMHTDAFLESQAYGQAEFYGCHRPRQMKMILATEAPCVVPGG